MCGFLRRVLIPVSFLRAVGNPCMHQEVVTYERSQAYPGYTHNDRDLSERRGASQIKVLSIGNTNIAMCAKRFPFSFS